MSPDAIQEAVTEAKRFLKAHAAWQAADKEALARRAVRVKADPKNHWFNPEAHVEHAALRRASMDLTRALAKMRRPQK